MRPTIPGPDDIATHNDPHGDTLFRGVLMTCLIGAIVGLLGSLNGCNTKVEPPEQIAPVTTPVAATPAEVPTPTPAPAPVAAPAAPAPVVAGHSLHDLGLTFENHAGEKVRLADLHGHPVVISMFYASCPAVCPTLIRDIRRIDESVPVGLRDDVRVLLVTFDPVADTPENLARLASNHNVDLHRWTLARAKDDDATRELATALGIRYRAVEDGHFNHTSIITLLDRQGAPLARIDGLNQDHTAFLATLAATR